MSENELSSRDDRVNDVILLYLQAVERGEAVDREKLLAEHAEIVEELKSFFGNQAQFQQVADLATLPPVPSIDKPSFDSEQATVGFPSKAIPNAGDIVRYFGDYELLLEIARGGMGIVYKARQANLNRVVALKMILAGQLAGPQDVQRFYTEAEAAAQLDHPGIVPVFEVGQYEGQHFFSMGFDGQRVLSVIGNDGVNRCTSQLWNASTGMAVGELRTHEAEVRTVMFSPDSKRFFTGTFGNGARLWDSDTGNSIGELMQHPLTATCVAFNSNGTRLVTGGEDRIAQLWEGYSGLPIGEGMKHDAAIFTVAFSPDGTRVATTSSDNGLRLWDARSGTPIGEPMKHGGRILSLAFSSDGAQIVTGAADKTARLWDVSTCASVEEVARFDQLTRSDASIESFSPDSSRFFVKNYDYSKRLWNSAKICDAQTGARVGAFLKVPDGSISGDFSPDSAKIFMRNTNGTAQLWNAKTGLPTGNVLNNFGEFLDFSPDSSRVLTRVADGVLCLWDTQTTLPIAKLMEHEGPVWSVAFSPDGTRFAAGSRNNFVRLFDARTGTPIGEALKHEHAVSSVAFSPDGKRLLTGSHDKTARLWDARNGEPIGAAMEHESWVEFAKFSPDGARIVTKSNKTLRLWNAYTGSSVGKVITHGAGIETMAFSPDGTRIATSNEDSLDSTVQLWDAANGTAVGEVMRHAGKITRLAFTGSGTHVLTGSYDHTVRLWDGFTGVPLLEPIKFNGFGHLAYSSDGSRIGTWLLLDTTAPDVERLSSVERRSILKLWTGYDADEDGTLHQLSPAEVDELRRQVGQSDPLRKFGVARRMRHVALACWEKVRTKSESDEGYRNVLDDAKSLVQFDPADLDYQVTLGTAQFRVGAWKAALETLTDADRRSRKTTAGPLPACLAVLAMAHQKLGHTSEAIACLQDLRQRFPQGTYDVGLRELLFEAEWVLNTGKYQWRPLDVDEMHSQGGATLTKVEDGSIRVSGVNPNSEIYDIRSTVDMPCITALRLETLRDQSLPNGGPGRSPTNGNFALTKISVTATDSSDESRVVNCSIRNAIADFTQIGHDVQDVIDGRSNTGWAVLHANGKTFDGALVLEFEQPVLVGNAVRLQVFIEHHSAWNWHALGRFRLSARASVSFPILGVSGNRIQETTYKNRTTIEAIIIPNPMETFRNRCSSDCMFACLKRKN